MTNSALTAIRRNIQFLISMFYLRGVGIEEEVRAVEEISKVEGQENGGKEAIVFEENPEGEEQEEKERGDSNASYT